MWQYGVRGIGLSKYGVRGLRNHGGEREWGWVIRGVGGDEAE